jgi:predicted small integral membrane protein
MSIPELRGGWADWLWAQLARYSSPAWTFEMTPWEFRCLNSNERLAHVRFATTEGEMWWATHVAHAKQMIAEDRSVCP